MCVAGEGYGTVCVCVCVCVCVGSGVGALFVAGPSQGGIEGGGGGGGESRGMFALSLPGSQPDLNHSE